MQTFLETNYVTNVKIGDKALRRDGNGGELDTWQQFTVNDTYWELMQEFPEDYRTIDGEEIILISVF